MSKVRRIAATVTAAVVLGVAAPAAVEAAPAPVARAASSARSTTDLSTYPRRVLTLTNRRRAAHGCGALRWNSDLHTAAARHTTLMARDGILSHLLAGELDLVGRILHAGYRPWRRVAENAAVGYPSPTAVVRGWMHSPGHRRNLLDCRLHDLGVAVVADRDGVLWWTQDFASH